MKIVLTILFGCKAYNTIYIQKGSHIDYRYSINKNIDANKKIICLKIKCYFISCSDSGKIEIHRVILFQTCLGKIASLLSATIEKKGKYHE